MTKRSYESFCRKYDIDPTDYEGVIEVVEMLDGMFGDADGKLQEIREYVFEQIDMYIPDEEEQAPISGETVYLYQVKPDKTREYGFMSFDYIYEKYKEIDLDNYDLAATIVVPTEIVENGDNAILNYVFEYGNTNQLYYEENPAARSVSVSDLVKIGDYYHYVDSLGFTDVTKYIKGIVTESAVLTEANEDIVETEEVENSEIENKPIEEFEEEASEKSLLDLLQDRIGQQMSVGELNTILQSLFGQFNKVFLLRSDLYNMDLDENQELIVDDDEEMYTIKYDIIDMDKGIVELTDVDLEY